MEYGPWEVQTYFLCLPVDIRKVSAITGYYPHLVTHTDKLVFLIHINVKINE